MGLWDAMLRRCRIRGVRDDGLVQTARVEALEHDAHDDVERFQDYGFAANPVEGQGLQIEVGGHTLVIRLDRLAERPHLPAYEVAVWHKEGHMVRLRAGRVVQVDCDQLVINASASVAINSPAINLNAAQTATTGGLSVAGTEMMGHRHGNVLNGGGTSGGPL